MWCWVAVRAYASDELSDVHAASLKLQRESTINFCKYCFTAHQYENPAIGIAEIESVHFVVKSFQNAIAFAVPNGSVAITNALPKPSRPFAHKIPQTICFGTIAIASQIGVATVSISFPITHTISYPPAQRAQQPYTR